MREIEDILIDYFEGEELSENDSSEFEKWFRQKKGAEFVRVLESMRGGKALWEELERDAEAGMEMIKRKLKKTRRRRSLWYGGVAAAVLFLLCGLAFLFEEPVVNRSELPGSEVSQCCTLVKLKLDNGEVLPLHGDQVGEVIVKDSCMRIENDNNTLICTNEGSREKIGFNTISVPVGAEYRVVLPDGTKVYLNADSEFRFPEMFSGEKREVFLKGEGYFEVAKDSTKRFIVHVLNMDATVLGTAFNIKAYPEQDEVVTTLEEGRLQVNCEGCEGYDLEAGDQVVFNKLRGDAVKKQVTTFYYTSWKDGFYSFDGENLETIMAVLAKWYGLEVFYMGENLKKNKFSGRLKRYDDFLYLLNKFEETGNVEFIVKDNVITIKGKKRSGM